MAEWSRAWHTLAMMKLWRREVVSLSPDQGTIVVSNQSNWYGFLI